MAPKREILERSLGTSIAQYVEHIKNLDWRDKYQNTSFLNQADHIVASVHQHMHNQENWDPIHPVQEDVQQAHETSDDEEVIEVPAVEAQMEQLTRQREQTKEHTI